MCTNHDSRENLHLRPPWWPRRAAEHMVGAPAIADVQAAGRPVRSVTWPALPPGARRRSGEPLLMSLFRSMVKRKAFLPLGVDAREYVAFGSQSCRCRRSRGSSGRAPPSARAMEAWRSRLARRERRFSITRRRPPCCGR
jgi:hypothetical protein